MAIDETSQVGGGQVGGIQVGAAGGEGQSIVGLAGLPSSVAFSSGGLIGHGLIAGFHGLPSSVAFGSGGYFERRIAGVAGLPSSVRFGAGGYFQKAIRGTAGLPSSLIFGTGGKFITRYILGSHGLPSSVALGSTGVFLSAARRTTVFIGGVDRTAWVGIPIKRTVMVAGKGSATFPLILNPDVTGRSDFRPAQFDKVLVYVNSTYRLFSGYVDSVDEQVYSGTNLSTLTVHCLQSGAIMDRRFLRIGIPPLPTGGVLVGDVFQYIASALLGQIAGWQANYDNAGSFIINGGYAEDVASASTHLTKLCQMFGLDWTVDQWDMIQIFDHTNGIGYGPYSLIDTPGTGARWISMSTQSGGAYANIVKVKNSRVVAGNMSDSDPYQFGYISEEQDAGEVAAHGPVEMLISLQDSTLGQMGDTASSELARAVAPVKTLTVESRDLGWEPAQRIVVDTARPPIDDTFLIEQVDSEELGKGDQQTSGGRRADYRHVIRMSNAEAGLQRRRSGVRFMQQLITAAIAQPQDRVTSSYTMTLAETLPGITNPGLATGPQGPPRTIDKTGILRSVTVVFKTTPTTTDCVIDVLINGTSIFGSGSEITYPAGASSLLVAQTYTFASNPYPVTQGDVITVDVLAADPTAMDGTLTVVTYG